MDVTKLAEKSMAMSEEVWARHANPWSVYTRFSICSALIKQDTLIMEYNPIIEVLNDKTNKQKLHGRI